VGRGAGPDEGGGGGIGTLRTTAGSTETDLARIARARLRSQRVGAGALPRAADVVRWLVAAQAQDFAAAKWALGLRMRAATDAAVEREFDRGAILRTHVLRPTWHFVAPHDIRWLLALTAPHVDATNAYYYRQADLDAAVFRKANRALARALRGGRSLTREELRQELRRQQVGDFRGVRLALVVMRAELDAVICSGPRRGRQFTYALLDERAPGARTLSRDAALAELATRYFTSRGPASVQDLAKWSGLAVSEARRSVEAAASLLRREVVDGRTLWSGRSRLHAPRTRPAAHLLPVYDEYVSSYRDRGTIAAPETARRLAAGAAFGCLLVVDEQVVGAWRRAPGRREVRLDLTVLRKLSPAERRAVGAAAQRFAAFAGNGRAAAPHLEIEEVIR
jgi:hypothetical protein